MTAIMDDDMSDLSPQITRAEPMPALPELNWTHQYSVTTSSKLPGDKISLPPSALEQLLAAAPRTVVSSASRPLTSTFDPYNPYTYAAERVARAAFEEYQPQLPHPLTFRLVNPENGRIIYAGIREFSAEEGEAVLSPFIQEALDMSQQSGLQPQDASHGESPETPIRVELQNEQPRITVQVKQIPKGTFVKLRPLEAGYDPEDWKALLEQHLRANFTTLTNQEVLTVTHGRESYRFLVDGFKPEGDAVCIVDTDIEVDIEALNEEQARETVKRIADKARRAPGTEHGSSIGGDLNILGKRLQAQIVDGDYVDYQIKAWPKGSGIAIEINPDQPEDELDLYLSPFGARYRTLPREDDYVWADSSNRSSKRIKLSPRNVGLEDAEAIYVSVHSYQSPEAQNGSGINPKKFTIRASVDDGKDNIDLIDSASPTEADAPPRPGDVRCKNCHQWVPAASLVLHENFCLRNNVLCPKDCGRVFQKRSEAFQTHWHCDRCDDTAHTYGDTESTKVKHDHLVHTSVQCPEAGCGMMFDNMNALAQHRSTECAGKLILCQFCHLEVPQGVPSDPSEAAECMLSNLTPHELADGARTTECHLCNKIVRLRDMRTHLLNHEMEKSSRPAPRVCRNVNCGRTLDGANSTGDTRAGTRIGNGPGNDIGLCSTCFGPLYVSMYDPEGKALKRRVERRYLSQLSQGCGKAWCRNQFCKTGRTHSDISPAAVAMKDGLPMIKPFLEGLLKRVAEGDEDLLSPLHFCVDENSQNRRATAEMLAAEGLYSFPWCIGALEAQGGKLDKARAWLESWAPSKHG